jgi:hypothetical protein
MLKEPYSKRYHGMHALNNCSADAIRLVHTDVHCRE